MALGYKISHPRGPNLIVADPQRLVSADKTRWACGRNYKVQTGYRTYGAVEAWNLKTRDDDGKVITVATQVDRKCAEQWVGKDGLAALKRWVRNGF